MNEPKNAQYIFNDALDTAFLDQMYGGDVSYTAQIFDIFLGQTLLEYDQLISAIQDEDGQRTYQVAHKIKPTFEMVGLTKTKELMHAIEMNAGDKPNFQKIRSLILEVNSLLEKFIPIIEDELKNMRKYLEKC